MNYTPIEIPSTDTGDLVITKEIAEIQAKNRAEWVAQLRSGKYAQAKQYLRKGDAYCCLGVMCNIIDSDNWIPNAEILPVFFFGLSSLMPSPTTAFQFGLRRASGMFRIDRAFLERFPLLVNSVTRTLMTEGCNLGLPDLNDSGISFAVIADIIEYGPSNMLLKVGDRWPGVF